MIANSMLPKHISKPVIIKEIVCKKNHRLLRDFGIIKGQVVQVRNEAIFLVEYYDKSMKSNRVIKLSRKLMKHFTNFNGSNNE